MSASAGGSATGAAAGVGRAADVATRIERLCAVGRSAGVTTVVVREPATLAWLLEARVHVPQTLDTACLDVVLDVESSRITVVTNAIEAPRLQETELDGLPVDWSVVPWWESRDERIVVLVGDTPTGSDRPVARLASLPLSGELAAMRRVLTARQQAMLAEVCRDAAAAATAAAQRISPQTSEYAAAGAFAAALLERGLDPIVLFVAGDDRIGPHRHPLPTGAEVGSRAMLVCCARRHGLVASVTRIVCFGTAGERAAYRELLEVERKFLDGSVVGARLGDIVTAGCAAYAAHGFAADEWHRHHQGGLSGLLPREFPAAPTSDVLLEPGHVVAWNPSGRGWKVEDTALVGDAGLRLLVDDGEWPTVEIGGRRRPDLMTV